MKCPALLSLCLLLCLSINTFSQPNRVKCKFGDVKVEDFTPTAYPVDSSADAVFLFDGGSSDFEGNNKGYLSIVYKKHARIRIMNKNAFDVATIEIPLYVSTFFEQTLDDLQASTYTVEDDKVVVTKIDKASVFKDKRGDYVIRKFTLPNIKEGCIIEYSYTVTTPSYYLLNDWSFQGKYPRLWSEYEVTVPEFYDYAVLHQGYLPYTIDTAKSSYKSYFIQDRGDGIYSGSSFRASGNTVTTLWAIKDVPALKNESYTSTIANYISRVEFQLSAIRYPNAPVKMVMRTWQDLCDELLKDESYGAGLTHGNGWLSDDVKKACEGASTKLEKATAIYKFVRNNYTCTDHDARYMTQSLKKVYQSKKGNVADINLLLIAMLQNAGFDVKPVMLSTKENGKTNDIYPMISKFNYTIAQLNLDDKKYFLDASYSKLGFNRLSEECYNGYGRIIDPEKPYVVDLFADSLHESKITSVFIVNDENDKLTASFSSSLGYFESLNLRQKLIDQKMEDYFKEMKKTYTMDVDITNANIDSLNLFDNPVTVKYEMKFGLEGEDLVYFSPMLAESRKENPFKAAQRFYPVEMSACTDELYVLNMDIPKGYEVDELPKSTRVNLNESEGMFEYLIAKQGDHIQLRSRVQIKKATFEPDDYQTLRDFFGYIVKKQAEQIVFKKVKANNSNASAHN